MKFIVHTDEQGWQLDDYFEYLQEIRNKIPPHVFAFAADSRHYDLTSHESLHDSWLEYFCVKEAGSGERRQIREIQIEACFFGPFHDLNIFIRYVGVEAFSLVTPEQFAGPPMSAVGHGDLLMHELRLESTGSLVHELLFSRGSVFQIRFRDMSFWTEIISTKH
jgi:hypothetical protein